MDLTESGVERAFRAEARAWLAGHKPPLPMPPGDTAEGFPVHRAWERELFDGGWAVVSWPEEYGGRGASLWEWLIFEEEYYAAGLPQRVGQNGIFLLAPTIFEFGTADQKERILRRMAAVELHSICADFVAALNRLLSQSEVLLDPPSFSEDAFREQGVNLIQISVRGRILQVGFAATSDWVSTEDFRVPYTLEGSVRAFNQALLEKDLIEEQLLFYTLEKQKKLWRFFDGRTYRSGPFDREYLIGLMEQLL